MKNAGLIALQIGIESGSQEVLDIQNKRISLNDMRVVAKEIAKVENVMLIGNIILGQSGDNESTYQESLLFIEELLELADFNLFISSGYLVPYVGTLIREKSKDFNLNILIDEFEYNQYSGYEYPICLPNNLSLSELENWKIIFNNTIYDFINKKLRQKSKKEIDRHIKWRLELEKKRISIKTPWYNTFMSSEIVKRYYELYFQDTTVTDYSEDNLSKNLDVIYPIALWEVMYNFQNDTWFISTFNGVIKLMEYELDLLNLANGKNSLQNIMNICRDKDNDCLTILNFYIKMCDNYELLFKRYF